jgi:hypothetical protein
MYFCASVIQKYAMTCSKRSSSRRYVNVFVGEYASGPAAARMFAQSPRRYPLPSRFVSVTAR